MITIPLICLSDVVQLLPVWRQALLRTVGSRGAAAYTEVVGRRLAPYYVEEEHQGVAGELLGHSPAIPDSSTITPSLTICVDALIATNTIDALSDGVPFSLSGLGFATSDINTVELRLTGGESVRTIGELLTINHTVQSIYFDSSFYRMPPLELHLSGYPGGSAAYWRSIRGPMYIPYVAGYDPSRQPPTDWEPLYS